MKLGLQMTRAAVDHPRLVTGITMLATVLIALAAVLPSLLPGGLGALHTIQVDTDRDRWWPSRLGLTREQREIEAETVAYIVCRRVGLKTKSDEYLAGYIENGEDLAHVSIDLIVKVASYIERMGKQKLPERKTRGE